MDLAKWTLVYDPYLDYSCISHRCLSKLQLSSRAPEQPCLLVRMFPFPDLSICILITVKGHDGSLSFHT